MYNSETWTLKQTQENRLGLRVFEISCLRRIAGVTCRDRNKEVCDRVGLFHDVANRIPGTVTANAVFWSCAKNGSYRIRNWHSTDMCMGQEDKEDPKRWIDMVKDDCKQRDHDIIKQYNTIQYDSVYLTCSKKLAGSQLSLPHGIINKIKL